MSKRKQLSIEELKSKQAEITAQLEAAVQAERATIGREVQRITGLSTWDEIDAKWQLIPRDSAPDKAQETASDDDEPFPIKDPFHLEATAK